MGKMGTEFLGIGEDGIVQPIPTHLYFIANVICVNIYVNILELNLHFTKQPYYTDVSNTLL